MGRKIEFNYEDAIDQATNLFWSKGYKKASMRDLLQAMKIGEGSFYNSLRDKENLYLECLRHYNRKVTARRFEALQSEPTLKEGVRKFFELVLEDLANGKNPRGCLMTNSLAPEVLEMPKIKNYIMEEMATFENYLTEIIEAARRRGEITSPLSSEELAQTLVIYLQGMFSVAGTYKKIPDLEIPMNSFLDQLGF